MWTLNVDLVYEGFWSEIRWFLGGFIRTDKIQRVFWICAQVSKP